MVIKLGPPSPWWIAVLAALVQGCGTMSKSECQSADWRTVGYEDGAMGASASRIGQHREACAKHGIAPDLNTYRQGRLEGLLQYCRPQNGFRLGERGASYAGICPPDVETDFLAAYGEGKRLYNIAATIRHTEKRLRSKEQELARLKKKRQSRQAELVRDGLSAGRRAELLVEVLEWAGDQGAIEGEIAELEVKLKRKRKTLTHERAAHSGY